MKMQRVLHETKQKGFTIVELLIVIVVIGILAAIVIVAFNGVQNRAVDTAVKNDFAQVAKKLEIFKVSNPSDRYPANATQLDEADFKLSQDNYLITRNNVYYCTSGDEYAFGIITKNNVQYYVVNGKLESASGVNYGNTCAELPSTLWGTTGHGDQNNPPMVWSQWTQ